MSKTKNIFEEKIKEKEVIHEKLLKKEINGLENLLKNEKYNVDEIKEHLKHTVSSEMSSDAVGGG